MKKTSNSRVLRTIPLLLMVVLFCPLTYGKVIYVDDDATGANNGTSWTDAYNHLQDGLADAVSGDEIRVAQGIYKPDLGGGNLPGNREAAFQLINGVVIGGGWCALVNVRDVEVYETILSGDLNGDDVGISVEDLGDEPTRAENSYHVLIGSGINMTAMLDGFIITGGKADGPWLDGDLFDNGRLRSGGGMYNYQGSPTLTNCTFSGNSADEGGGMCSFYNNVTLTNCTFSRNSAGRGGGMNNYAGSVILTNCTFSGNSADEGGGMCSSYNNVTLTNCTFSRNSAVQGGGGMRGRGSSSQILMTNCTFSGNSADEGGGMCSSYNNVTLTNCTFSRNSAGGGGGMYNRGSGIFGNADVIGRVTLTNCTFSGNYGGGMNSMNGDPILTNCTFSGNYGSAIDHYANHRPGGPTLTNCTFSGNYGGAVLWHTDWASGVPILTNCILWYNTPNEIPQPSTITYSNIQGGWEGESNINEDPLFANPGYWAEVNDANIIVEPNDSNAVWIEGDYHLKSQAGRFDPNTQTWVQDDVTSPCIDAGNPLTPLMYEPFPRGCIINMGAYGGSKEASKSPFGCSYELDGE